jgi:RNA polymerase sigma-70 factor (ECF subfamily)
VGIFFVLFGEYKVFGADFTVYGGFEQWVRSFLAEGASATTYTIYRQAFQLRDIEERGVKEAAETRGIRVPSVKVRLYRARMMLQKQLSPPLKSVTSSPKRR